MCDDPTCPACNGKERRDATTISVAEPIMQLIDVLYDAGGPTSHPVILMDALALVAATMVVRFPAEAGAEAERLFKKLFAGRLAEGRQVRNQVRTQAPRSSLH